jgi:DNA repair protein RadA/Sms
VSKVRSVLACTGCGQQLAQWAGRCPGCDAWGTIEASGGRASSPGVNLSFLTAEDGPSRERISTGYEGIDRVLGGGIVPASVMLLAGEPGIGKSTLLLQLVSNLSSAGRPCLIASGEESRDQVAERARRLGLNADGLGFVNGRDLPEVLAAAFAESPFLLALDSIQALRDPDASGIVGGPGQVRACADALVGLAKSQGISVLMTGHVTKDGDLAGPRTLEHAVDVVMSFEGDPRSGHRMLAGGKNRFGQEGEAAWFEMGPRGLVEADPGSWLSPGVGEPGTATALPMAGRRALAVEVQALVVPVESGARRQATGLDARRFQLVAAVVDRVAGVPVARADLYGASSGGIRLDDPGCDLAVAASLTSAATGHAPPSSSAFVGEVGLTGQIRPVPGMQQRLAAARARGITTVFAPAGCDTEAEVTPVRHIRDALAWAPSTRR